VVHVPRPAPTEKIVELPTLKTGAPKNGSKAKWFQSDGLWDFDDGGYGTGSGGTL
jgi:hypothetical protein